MTDSDVTFRIIEHPVSIGAEWVGRNGVRNTILMLKLIDNPRPKYFIDNEFLCEIYRPERFGPIPTDATSMREYARRFEFDEPDDAEVTT